MSGSGRGDVASGVPLPYPVRGRVYGRGEPPPAPVKPKATLTMRVIPKKENGNGDRLDGTVSASTGYWVGWGTGAGTAAKADTALFTESTEARVICAESQPTADKNRWVGTITAGATKTITNAGLFSSSGGSMLVHGDFAGIALSANDAIEFTIDLEQT